MSEKAVTGTSSWNIFRLPAIITNVDRKIKSLLPQNSGTDSARSPKLPLDVCESIIHILRDDPSTLSACSLACREWLYAIHSHRFSRVCLTDRNITTFLDLLRFSPEIGPHVKHLLVQFSWSTLYEPLSTSVGPDLPSQKLVRPMSTHLSQEASLDEVCVHLQTVESLSLNGVIVTSSLLSTLSRLTTVKTVEVGRGLMSSLVATSDELMTALPRAFPLLTRVIIKAPPHVHPSAIQVENYNHSRLGLGGSPRRPAWYFPNDPGASPVRGWGFSLPINRYKLQGSTLVHSYLHGSIEAMRGANGCGLQAFLQGVGASIEDLSIHVYALKDVEREVVESSLAQCTNLRSIGFYGMHLGHGPHMHIWLSEYLSLVKTNGVRTICFHVYPAYEVTQSGLMGLRTLHTLQPVLAQEQFCNLEKVMFYIDREDVRILVEEFVRREVPALDARGLLSFVTM